MSSLKALAANLLTGPGVLSGLKCYGRCTGLSPVIVVNDLRDRSCGGTQCCPRDLWNTVVDPEESVMDKYTIKSLKVSCLVIALFAVLGIAPVFVVGAW